MPETPKLTDVFSSPSKEISWEQVLQKYPEFVRYAQGEKLNIEKESHEWTFQERNGLLWAEVGLPAGQDARWAWLPKQDAFVEVSEDGTITDENPDLDGKPLDSFV